MLEIRNVYKTFNPGTINEKKALNGLSLHLKPGEFVTVRIEEALDYDLIAALIK